MVNSIGDDKFQTLLADFDTAALETYDASIYGLWPDFTLAYLNPGWFQFAAHNNGEPKISSNWKLGRCILDAIAEPLRPFFAENYGRCLGERRPWEHLYECSTAEVYRLFHMSCFPLGDAGGLLIVNSLRKEAACSRVPCTPSDELYRDEHGIVVQCCHCRRVRRNGEEPAWDWVPAWVATPHPSTSHGICAVCFGFHHCGERLKIDHVVQSFRTGSETRREF